MATFLQALARYGQQMGVPPPMYRQVSVRYLFHLDREGQLLDITDTTASAQEGSDLTRDGESAVGEEGSRKPGKYPSTRPPLQLAAPDLKRSSGVRPKLFSDRGDYTLGYLTEGEDPVAVAQRHASYVERVRQCATATGSADVRAVLQFLEALHLEELPLPPDYDPEARITFVVAGNLLVDAPEVRQFWGSTAGFAVNGVTMQCFVCLQERPPVRILSVPIFHIPNGQTMGMSLVSMNEPAFWSYGEEHTLNSPICADCEQRVGTALNMLLLNPDTHWRGDDRVYLFWPKDRPPLPMDQVLRSDTPSALRLAFASAHHGGDLRVVERAEHETTPFYTAVIKANAARIVLLQFKEQAFGEVIQHLRSYFERGRVAVFDREAGEVRQIVIPLWQLRNAAVRVGGSAREKAAQIVEQSLLRLALEGTPVPTQVAQLVINRALIERAVRPTQAALLQLYLSSSPSGVKKAGGTAGSPSATAPGNRVKSNGGSPMDTNAAPAEAPPDDPIASLVGLELDAVDVPYILGRTLVLLEEIQYAAHRRLVNKGLRNRFIGMASLHPAQAWAILLREVEPLQAKISRRNAALGTMFEKRLAGLLAHVTTVPTQFTVTEQARFLLATHHQRYYEIESKRLARTARQANDPVADESALLAEHLAEEGPASQEGVA